MQAQCILMAFLARGWSHLDKLPGSDEFRSIARLDRQQKVDPRSYEVVMLRKELAEHLEECRKR
ncbi:hypothetical protein [Arthrobacter sp. A2-55]|uniref:hypothetical protein n=1 Tax=Arthrobacter sp. A2-55 TaxID=2897337 RepID=UPI0021CD45AE|nr:hypothetical protein [Arthrobacter sp. A2-55]MCU6480495.1 hypothetical protein [Arthrobacter sp. A2-55]